MSETLPLDVILGPEQAARVLNQLADAMAHQDRIPPAVALRLACERATDGDPLLIAAPGQTWTLRLDVDPDDAPAQHLAIHARLSCPPRVLATGYDDRAIDGETDELLIEVLELYRLTSWRSERPGDQPGRW